MTTSRPSLPEYAHPPLVAATLGVVVSRAVRLDEINPSMLERYQQKLGPEWIGRWTWINGSELNDQLDYGVSNHGNQLKNVLGDRIIRLTSHTFGFTWWGTDDTRYPRYESLRDGFVAAWDLWCELHPEFARHSTWWTVIYLNQMPQGTVWQSPADWSFFRFLIGVPDLAKQVRSACFSLAIPGLSEELGVDWAFDGGQTTDSLASIWLRLTAHGEGGNEVSTVLNGMDAGRAAIVKTFSNLMSPAANAYWGLKRREK